MRPVMGRDGSGSVSKRKGGERRRALQLGLSLLLTTGLYYLIIARRPGSSSVGPQPWSGGAAADSSNAELDAALAHRVCPAYKPGAQPSIAFLHIPKTAGMLLVQTFQGLMPDNGPGRWCNRNDPEPDLPPVYSTCSSGQPDADHIKLFNITQSNFLKTCSGFAAHQDYAFFDAVGIDPTRTVTLIALRHPVDRVISDYFYSLKVGAPWLANYKPANASDFSGLEQFVLENRDTLNNIGTQMVGCARHCQWPGTGPNTPMDRVLEVAKRNLERTCVILLTEYLEESLLRLGRAAGWPGELVLSVARAREEKCKAQDGQRVNATPRPQVPQEVRELIAQQNSLDMQLYEHAVRLFKRQAPASATTR